MAGWTPLNIALVIYMVACTAALVMCIVFLFKDDNDKHTTAYTTLATVIIVKWVGLLMHLTVKSSTKQARKALDTTTQLLNDQKVELTTARSQLREIQERAFHAV